PETVMGRPALRAIWRAILAPVAPSGLAQPMITSSTSAGSMPARCTACWTTWPPSVAPWVMLKAPFQLLARGVRAVETMTALVMMGSSNLGACGHRSEGLAFGREAGQQRRGLPELRIVQRVALEALHGLHHVEQPHLVRIVQRATAVHREAVAEDVDHVDVAGLVGYALLQDVGGLVDQTEHQALHDRLVGDLARRDDQRLAVRLDHLHHLGIRNGVALARHVVVPALADLLAEAPLLAQQVGGLAVLEFRVFLITALADRPADVVAGQVAHAERPHGETE